ncbi:uncharacterized protein LOC129585569 [Paramacrobiotus metropolitanus]|uniref:uncharacterized protein LOC129585569 n=1 Tax=Paramacrobiotus metropolitanus TaxID=2943436 RepID=UPI002445CF5D|nr:uncharacterized protein LOC129585569 [Paramacrobiotus metropolitanus]
MESRKRCLSSPLHYAPARRRRLRSDDGASDDAPPVTMDETPLEDEETVIQHPAHYDADVSDCGDLDTTNIPSNLDGSAAESAANLHRVRDSLSQTNLSFLNNYDFQSAVAAVMQMAEAEHHPPAFLAPRHQHRHSALSDDSEVDSHSEVSFSWDMTPSQGQRAGPLDDCEVLRNLGLASPGLSPIRDIDRGETPMKDTPDRGRKTPRSTAKRALKFSPAASWPR